MKIQYLSGFIFSIGLTVLLTGCSDKPASEASVHSGEKETEEKAGKETPAKNESKKENSKLEEDSTKKQQPDDAALKTEQSEAKNPESVENVPDEVELQNGENEQPIETEPESDWSEADVKKLPPGAEEVMVVRVISGDTVEVLGEKGKETVRLLLADTPSDPSQDSMFGYQAAAFTKMSIDGQMVFLERGEGYIEGQKPTLGYIWLKQSDPVNFNKLLLSSGYARMVPSERNPKYETEFRKAEAEAKLAKRGIWEMEGYVTEEGFDSSVVE